MTSGINIAKYTSYLHRFRANLLTELNEIYKPALNRKEDLIGILKEKSEKVLQSELARKMRVAKGFYQLEISPPNYKEMKVTNRSKLQEDFELAQEFYKKGCYKYITVRQAWLLFLVGLEIGLWFFLGETIGKMHIVGYKV